MNDWHALSNEALAREIQKQNLRLTGEMRELINERMINELQLSNPNEQVVHDLLICLM